MQLKQMRKLKLLITNRMKQNNFKFIQLFIALLILSIFAASTGKSQTINEKISNKIINAELKEVSINEHSKLEIAGKGEDQIQVLTVWGTAYEMGKAPLPRESFRVSKKQ